MIVNINDEYFVEVDSLNHTLKRRRVSKTGKERIDTIGYYGNMVNALNGYVKLCQIRETEETIRDYIKAIEAVNNKCLEEIEQSVKEINNG